MATILPQEITSSLPDSFVVFLAGKLNETEEHIRSVTRYGTLATTWIILRRNETEGAEGLLNLSRHALAAGHPQNFESMIGKGQDAVMLPDTAFAEDLCEGHFSQLVVRISNFTRVKAVTVRLLLQIIAPLSLGIIGSHAVVNKWSAGDLSSWLRKQETELYESLPPGLNLGSLSQDASQPNARARLAPAETRIVSRKKLNLMPFVAMIVIVLALVVLFFCYRSWSIHHGDPLHLKSLF